MNLLENILKHIFKIENVNISPTFKLFSDISINVKIIKNEKDQIEGVNLASITPKQEQQIAKLFHQSPSGTAFIEATSNDLIHDATVTLFDKNQHTVSFFDGKIPMEDLTILKAAVVLRAKFKNGENVDIYKQQLIRIYGQKANVITNLCTAGYFEDFLIPLYNGMSSEPNFIEGDFTQTYIKLVQEFPIAIFVSTRKKKTEVEEVIRTRIEKNKLYAVPLLNIHGIGNDNVKIIEKVLASFSKGQDYTDLTLEKIGHIIIARLRFD